MWRRKLLIAAIAAGMSAVVVLLVGALLVVQSFSLTPMLVDGQAPVQVETTGMWLVATEQRSRIDGIDLVSADVEASHVMLVDPAGGEHALVAPDVHITYALPDREGTVIGRVLVDRSGQWQIMVSHHDSPVLLAVGPDPIGAMTMWLMIAGGVAIVLLGVALGCGWVVLRRSGDVHSVRGSPHHDAR